MDKEHLRRIAIYPSERPYEIEQFILWYQERYNQQPSYEEIAEYLQVEIGTVKNTLRLMKVRGFEFSGRTYKTIGVPAA